MSHMRFRAVTAFVLLMVLCSCSQEKQPSNPDQWMKTSDIQPYPTRQSKLTDPQVTRIKKLQTNLADVDDSSLDKWVEDFEKDRNPEKEIRLWEAIAAAYQEYSSTHALIPQAKKEVFGVLILRSGTTDEAEIVKHANLVVLTEKQARDVMADYKGEASPLEVEMK